MRNKVSIITSDNRAIKQNSFNNLKYNDLSFYINSAYCLNQGYQFSYFRMIDLKKNQNHSKKDTISSYCTKSKLTKSPSWTKLLVIYQNFLKKNDYVVYLDSDCFFNNHKISIQAIIEKLEQTKKIGLFFNDGPWNKDLPNCGFMILKNSEFNRQLLKKWWNAFSLYSHVHPYEQKVFQKMWSKNYRDIQNKFILKKTSLQESGSNKFLKHITSNQNNLREIKMKNFIIKNLKFYKSSFNKFMLKNQKNFNPLTAENAINRKVNFFDRLIIKFHQHMTLNIIFYIKKIKG